MRLQASFNIFYEQFRASNIFTYIYIESKFVLSKMSLCLIILLFRTVRWLLTDRTTSAIVLVNVGYNTEVNVCSGGCK